MPPGRRRLFSSLQVRTGQKAWHKLRKHSMGFQVRTKITQKWRLKGQK
jgi:hypothetical protein